MTHLQRVSAFTLITFITLLVHAGPSPATAQTVLTSPRDVANCLCLDRNVNDLRTPMEAQKQAYQSERLRLDVLKERIEQQRPRVNVDDPASIEAFKSLLDQLDAGEARFRNEVTTRYDESVQRYNAAVQAFDASCRGKFYDGNVLEAVQPTLVCPKP